MLNNGSMLLAFFCTQKNIKVNNFYRFDCAQWIWIKSDFIYVL